MTYRNSKVKRPEVDWPDSKHLILTCKTRDTGGSGIRATVLKEGSFCSFIFTTTCFLFGLQYFNFSWFPIWKRRKFGKEESVHRGSWKSSKNHRDFRGGETQVQHPLFRWKPWESGKLQGLSKVTYSSEQGPSMQQQWQRDRNSPTVTCCHLAPISVLWHHWRCGFGWLRNCYLVCVFCMPRKIKLFDFLLSSWFCSTVQNILSKI